MDTSPSPAPSSADCSNDNDYTYKVEALVIVAVVGMFLLHVLGSLRRLSSNNLLHTIVMGVNTLSFPLVGYTLGTMKKSGWYYYDFPLWAVFLVLLLGSTDSLTACRLSDIDNWKSIYVNQVFKGFVLLFVIWLFSDHLLHQHLLFSILAVVVIKGYVRIASMRMVSKSYIGENVKVIIQYMKKDNKLEPFDPVTMEGYKYMVAGEKYCCKGDYGMKQVTTVEQIWQCKGRLLVLERKDLCLSMALSKMLNLRFAGFKLSEADLGKNHDFVFKGLLAGNNAYQRVFRVIEQELVFVHDLYYTRYSYLYQKGRYFILCLPLIMIALCMWLTSEQIMHIHHYQHVTISITVVLAFLEAYQLYLYIASGWFKVALILSYISTPFFQRSGCFLEMIMGLLLSLKAFSPWKARLGQYCLLQELGRQSRFKNFLHYATLRLVDKAKKGRNSVKLSENVKKAVVDSLLGSNGHLTNGVRSLKKNRVHDHLSWACDATGTDGAVTRTIVVWHIATTLCEHLDKQAKEDDVKTASTLSKYCMHLLAFAPNLLPDHSCISQSILDESIDEASKLLKGANKDKNIKGKTKKTESRCEVLMEICPHDCVAGETRLVAQGVHLARQLLGNIQDSKMRWEALSDFWAEMMLYVSPSDDARVHLEVLARGGEFITHLWVLLTHGGVLNRPHTEPKNRPATPTFACNT
ncbi:hypothetical protein HU200_013953 [Digitaria exilis]|uniref:DUF4220 domain-containing protein n=1 Tax=Digitaria exilis TaxID=1010633 RepID=A0A835FC79_9POAL|nr:hypothetical protein HU200_013953 [Digitaria exilis]